MKGHELRASMNGVDEAPGKTWFWELEAAVLDTDRCVQCGTCVAVCPSNSLGVNVVTNLPELVKMCTGCSLCWDFCPRAGLRYEATWLDRAPATGADDGAGALGEAVEGLGAVRSLHSARARHRAPGAQDGGVVTAILGALLDAGELDGVVVSRPSTRRGEEWRGVATVATTHAELEAGAGSFYNQTMALAALDLTGVALPPEPRLAVVGTPCEVQGLTAMQRAPWSTGRHRVDAVVLSIALLCTKSFDYTALIQRALRDERGVDLAEVRRIDVTAGRLTVELADGSLAVDEPVKAFHGAALKGCDECADFLGRGADLSVGSVGSHAGSSTLLVRTAAGRRALEVATPRLELADGVDVDALRRLDALDKRRAMSALGRDLDPDGPLFVDLASYLADVEGTTRAPVAIRR
ncbi:MAG TPA: Coenzyme F420 hydrogenase/dehydrogenase, beta subunit C-terminal domain [Acidimicrobiales bacterium]|nr:Coenzyme F420 hydrogenase/dehydrogenase, beta subunit C-terminal domain [Acidimicrobiales bacterium]